MTKLGVLRKPIAFAASWSAETAPRESGLERQASKATVSRPSASANSTSASLLNAPRSGRKLLSACLAKRRLAYSNMRFCSAAQKAPCPALTDSEPTTGRWRNSICISPGLTYSSTRKGSMFRV